MVAIGQTKQPASAPVVFYCVLKVVITDSSEFITVRLQFKGISMRVFPLNMFITTWKGFITTQTGVITTYA